MKRIFLISFALIISASLRLGAADSEQGFVSIFDGKTFQGWKRATENTNTWSIEDGALVAHGKRCHLFIGHLASGRVDIGVKLALHRQAGFGRGCRDQFQDEGEEAAYARRIVGNTRCS